MSLGSAVVLWTTQNTSLLLASPHIQHTNEDPGIERIQKSPERHKLSPAIENVGDGKPFFTEPYRDFSIEEERENFAKAIAKSEVPQVERITTKEEITRVIDKAHTAFPTWRDEEPLRRSQVLVKVAELMRQRRDELCGVVMRESGKTWREADGDVCESIDFCEYYARMAPQLFEYERLGEFIGELDQQFYQPRGVAAVISPWNFPMAICCGMTVAALVTGNTVLVKPAGQTTGIAKLICEMLWEAGAPKDVLHFVAGPGSHYWFSPRSRSSRCNHCVYRFKERWFRYSCSRWSCPRKPTVREEGCLRDGWQKMPSSSMRLPIWTKLFSAFGRVLLDIKVKNVPLVAEQSLLILLTTRFYNA